MPLTKIETKRTKQSLQSGHHLRSTIFLACTILFFKDERYNCEINPEKMIYHALTIYYIKVLERPGSRLGRVVTPAIEVFVDEECSV